MPYQSQLGAVEFGIQLHLIVVAPMSEKTKSQILDDSGNRKGSAFPPDVEAIARSQLLLVALRNSTRSIPLQLVAIAFVVWLGFDVGQTTPAYIILAMGLLAALWRAVMALRFRREVSIEAGRLKSAEFELTANSTLTGLMWTISTWSIYPALHGQMSVAYLVMICGSVTIAALFMSLVGYSFIVLAVFQLGSVILVSLLNDAVHSLPLAVLVFLFGATAYRASSEFGRTALSAVVHGISADAANATLKKAKEAAEAANMAKSQFLAVMTHEIRTPMNGVLGALELLQYSRMESAQRELVNTAYTSGRLLLGLLNDILDLSKIEAGKLELARDTMSLHSLVASVITLFRPNANQKGLQLALEISEGVPDHVVGDAARLRQVILNLVGNAIKFTDHGAVTLKLSNSQPGRGGFVVVYTGRGISETAQQHLFDRFYQASSGSTRQHGGTGLGLAISQHIVEAMGGHIEVSSKAGEGSVFSFSISLEQAPQPMASGAANTLMTIDDILPTRKGTIMVVDDNEVNRTIANQMLTTLGHQVIEVDDGAKALERLESEKVDLILMDCQMPVMDGYTTAKLIREKENKSGTAHLPIVAMTANAYESDVAKALDSGMDGHIAKPYSLLELRDKVATWLQAA